MTRLFSFLFAALACTSAGQVVLADTASQSPPPTTSADNAVTADQPMVVADEQPDPENTGDTLRGAVTITPPTDEDLQIAMERTRRNYIDRLTDEQEQDITDKAFPLNAAIWDSPQIFVCWEDMDPVFSTQRDVVRSAVRDTWEAASALEFFGWKQCRDTSQGIRIAVQDIGPHVKKLGKFGDGVPEGMVLNFIYDIWEPACFEQQDYCNRILAVHEFGHAIGFAHEQNRPDTPADCTRAQGDLGDDTSLTPWDPDSVMNYCNPVSNNDGVLSALDVAAVQFIYGE